MVLEKSLVLFALCIIVLSSTAYALDFDINIEMPRSRVPVYDGGDVFLTGTVTNNADYCAIECTWSTTHTTFSNTKFEAEPAGGKGEFKFKVLAKGQNGEATPFDITINCNRISSFGCSATTFGGSDSITKGPFSFSFLYAGDGTCTTSEERCARFGDFDAAPSDCACSADKQCFPNSERGADDRGCATFCGNGKVERQFESCNSCPSDVGKCDGASCSRGSDCEGKYCVHSRCSHKPFIENDGFCDSSEGENCANSGGDCGCGVGERCNRNTKRCETFCGNEVCEPNEERTCKLDCDWCGDGSCQQGKEDCRNCALDCGVCELTQEETQFKEQVVALKQEAQVSAVQARKTKTAMRTAALSGIGVIAAAIVIWLIYKFFSGKRPKEKKPIKSKKKAKMEKVKSKRQVPKFVKDIVKKLNIKSPNWFYFIVIGVLLLSVLFIFVIPFPYTAVQITTEQQPFVVQKEAQQQVPYTTRECSGTPFRYNVRTVEPLDAGFTCTGSLARDSGEFKGACPYLTRVLVGNAEPAAGSFQVICQYSGGREDAPKFVDINPFSQANVLCERAVLKGETISRKKPQIIPPKIETCETVTKFRDESSEEQITEYREVQKQERIVKYASLYKQWTGQAPVYFES